MLIGGYCSFEALELLSGHPVGILYVDVAIIGLAVSDVAVFIEMLAPNEEAQAFVMGISPLYAAALKYSSLICFGLSALASLTTAYDYNQQG